MWQVLTILSVVSLAQTGPKLITKWEDSDKPEIEMSNTTAGSSDVTITFNFYNPGDISKGCLNISFPIEMKVLEWDDCSQLDATGQ